MIVSLPTGVMDRLRRIEFDEGVPVLDQIHQAAAVWSWLRGSKERMIVGLTIMRVVAYRDR